MNEPKASTKTTGTPSGVPIGCPEPLSVASMLRAAADGELSPAQRERLEAHLAARPEDAGRVRFEQELRACCRRAYPEQRCPEALRAKVMAMAPSAVASSESSGGLAEGLEQRAAATRQRSFWASRGPALAAAAGITLLLTAGVALMQFGGGAGGLGGPLAASGTGQGGSIQTVAYRDEVARFVAKEHNRCWESPSAADRKFRMHEPAEIQSYFETLLGARIDLPAWHQPTEALIFRGAGRCSLPKTDARSAHLRFDLPAAGDRPASGVSLFVAPDLGEMPVVEGTTYAIKTGECGVPGSSILVWKKGGMLFYLVSDAAAAKAGACDKVRTAVGMPAAMVDY